MRYQTEEEWRNGETERGWKGGKKGMGGRVMGSLSPSLPPPFSTQRVKIWRASQTLGQLHFSSDNFPVLHVEESCSWEFEWLRLFASPECFSWVVTSGEAQANIPLHCTTTEERKMLLLSSIAGCWNSNGLLWEASLLLRHLLWPFLCVRGR